MFIAYRKGMRTLPFILLCVIFLTGCDYQVYQPTAFSSQQIPTYPQTYPAKIYGEADSIENAKSLILVNAFNLDMHPTRSQKEAADSLKRVSQDLGYDVIKVVKSKLFSWDESTLTAMEVVLSALSGTEIADESITYSTHRYIVKAYKYLDNFKNLDQLPYSRELFRLSDEGIMDPISRQFFKPNGEQLKVTGNTLNLIKLHRFSEDYLLNEEKGWRYRWVNENKMVRRNQFHRVILHFSGSGLTKLPSDVERRDLINPTEKYTISIFYDNDGKVTNKEVLFGGNLYASMRYEFDAIGRISKELIDMHQSGEKFQMLYEYYDQARLLNYADSEGLREQTPLTNAGR